MPDTGQIVGGTLTFFIGLVVFSYFRQHGEFSYETDIRWPWEYRKGVWYYTIASFFAGLFFIGLGLNTLQMSDHTIMILIPSIALIRYHKIIGKVMSSILIRNNPTVNQVKRYQYGLLVISLMVSAWAIYLYVRDWT